MGRPPTKPKKLRDGFYIEIRNKGSKSGIKIRRDNKEQMLDAIKEYEKIKGKDVTKKEKVKDKYTSKTEEITTTIYDSAGNKADISAKITPDREGK